MLLPLVGSENQETCHVSVIGGYGSILILSCREPGRKDESSRVCWTYVLRWGSRLSPRAGLQVLCAVRGPGLILMVENTANESKLLENL